MKNLTLKLSLLILALLSVSCNYDRADQKEYDAKIELNSKIASMYYKVDSIEIEIELAKKFREKQSDLLDEAIITRKDKKSIDVLHSNWTQSSEEVYQLMVKRDSIKVIMEKLNK